MNVLIPGSGGREHVLAWKLAQSKNIGKLFVAPGNAGTEQMENCTNLPISPMDFEGIKAAVLKYNIDMVVVGPEDPLANGIVDFFQADDDLCKVATIGPNKEGAQLEASKDWAKKFMCDHNIPTAYSVTIYEASQIKDALDKFEAPYVLKADGLAAGKGVLIIQDREEAEKELKAMLDGKFGKASETVVIEKFLDGIELSVFVLTDGKSYITLPTSKDYKKIGEGDTGLNTGGMGAVSPVPFADEEFMAKVDKQIIAPTIAGLQEQGIDYKGIIYFGLINVDGEIYVIEFNIRFGDPEAQVVIPRIKNDLLELFNAIHNGTLDQVTLEVDPRVCAATVLVSKGYPGNYDKGKLITGIGEDSEDAVLFHAGTKIDNEGNVVTNGGRIAAVSAKGENIPEALLNSKKGAIGINYYGKYFRHDIGHEFVTEQNTVEIGKNHDC